MTVRGLNKRIIAFATASILIVLGTIVRGYVGGGIFVVGGVILVLSMMHWTRLFP